MTINDSTMKLDEDLLLIGPYLDCPPESGPVPHGPGSGPDRPHKSKCPGQWEVDRTQLLSVQVQVVSGLFRFTVSIILYIHSKLLLYFFQGNVSSFEKRQNLKLFITPRGRSSYHTSWPCCLFPCHNHVPHVSVSFLFIPFVLVTNFYTWF